MRHLLSLCILLSLQSCFNFKFDKSSSTTSGAGGSEVVAAPKLCAEEADGEGCDDTPTVTPPPAETETIVPDENQVVPSDPTVLYETKETPTQKVKCEDVKLEYTSHRSGTVTLAGQTAFIPGKIPKDKMNSSYFSSIPAMQKFLASKAEHYVRFKVRPSPKRGCFNQKEISDKEKPWGYTVLSYRVSLVPLTEKGELLKEGNELVLKQSKTFETSTYTCSMPHHLDVDEKTFPHGFVMVITDVGADRACWYNKEKSRCKGFKPVPENHCWQMDIESFSVTSDKEFSSEEELELEEYGSEK